MHMQTYDTRTRTSFTTLHVPTFVRKRRSCAKKVRIAPTEPRSPSSCAQRPTEHPERTRDPREQQRAPKRRAARCQAEPPHTIPNTKAQTARSHSARGAAAAAAVAVVVGDGGYGSGNDGGRHCRRLAAHRCWCCRRRHRPLGPRSASALALGPRHRRLRTHASTRESILDRGLAQVVGEAGGARVRVGVGSPVDRRGTRGGSTQTEE